MDRIIKNIDAEINKKRNIVIVAVILFAGLKNVNVPHGDQDIYGYYGDIPFYVNDLIYFVCQDTMILFLTIGVNIFYSNRNTRFLIWLAVGKLFDEFTHPFGYGETELIWDAIGLLLYFINHKKKNEGDGRSIANNMATFK